MVLTLAVLLCGAANAYYGFSGDPARRAEWPLSTVYPENAYQLRMIQPDGVVRILQRDPDDPHALVCPAPWVGEVRGRQTLVMTDPEFRGGQTGFVFESGVLDRMLLDGKEYAVPRPKAATLSLGSLWSEVTDEMVRKATARYGKHWDGRFRLWYRNPNGAAMLMVEVFLLALGALVLRRKWIVWPLAVPLMAACFYGLVRTGSRGGMVGLICGVGCFLVFRLRAFLTWRRMLLVALAFGAVALGVHLSGATERFTTGLIHEGYSDVSRIPIWIEVPRMMVSSFSGWGLGESGTAYMNWFQPLDRFHGIAGLISSHLTWLVEFGWPMRVVYALLWLCGLCCLAADALRGRSVLPVAVWTAFFVGSIFNSLELEWSLWVLPLAALAVSLSSRPWRRCREYILPSVCGVALSAGLLALAIWLGSRPTDAIRICGNRDLVIVNGNVADIWIVDDGQVLDGNCLGILGKDMRRWYSAHWDANPVGLVKKLENLPCRGIRRLVLAGKSAPEFLKAFEEDPARFASVKELVFLSPSLFWQDIPEDVRKAFDVKVIVGSLVAGRSDGEPRPPQWVRIVPGCAVYINNWLRHVTEMGR